MLPDYPKVKQALSAELNRFVQRRMAVHLGHLSKASQVRMFEGHGTQLRRASGEQESSEFEGMSAVMQVPLGDIPTLTPETLFEKLDGMAREMAQKMGEKAYASVSEAVDKVGNVLSAKNAGLTAATLIDAFSMLDIDFNEDGTPQMPSLHVHPSVSDAAHKAVEALEANEGFRKRFTDMLTQQREEWRAREASRRLVG